MLYRVGDKLKCVRPIGSLILGAQYEVESVVNDTVLVKSQPSFFLSNRFIPWIDPIDEALEEFDAVSGGTAS